MTVAICHFSRLFDKSISIGLLKDLKTAFSTTALPRANSLNPQEVRSSCTAACRNASACASVLHLQSLDCWHHFFHSQFLRHHLARYRHVEHGHHGKDFAGGRQVSVPAKKSAAKPG